MEFSHLAFKGHVTSYIFAESSYLSLKSHWRFLTRFCQTFTTAKLNKEFQKTINKPKGTKIRRAAKKRKIDKLIVSGIDIVGRKSLKLFRFSFATWERWRVNCYFNRRALDLEKLADLVMTTVKAIGLNRKMS